MDLSTVVIPMACGAMVRTSPAAMGVTTTNGVVVIAAGKKRSEQNHALLDREFGGINSGFDVIEPPRMERV